MARRAPLLIIFLIVVPKLQYSLDKDILKQEQKQKVIHYN